MPDIEDGRLNGKLLDTIDLITLEFSFEAAAVAYQAKVGIDIPTIILINLNHRNRPFSKTP